MIFRELPLLGAYTIDLEPIGDDRGFFSRYFCEQEFGKQGLNTHWVQVNNSFNKHRGTLRGLHSQATPHQEVKLVRCVRGAIWDVIVDLRPASTTFGRWAAEELSSENRRMMYVPEGFAHGFISLTDDTELIYFVSKPYHGTAERILRWNDPLHGIKWPIAPTIISDKDANAVNWPTV